MSHPRMSMQEKYYCYLTGWHDIYILTKTCSESYMALVCIFKHRCIAESLCLCMQISDKNMDGSICIQMSWHLYSNSREICMCHDSSNSKNLSSWTCLHVLQHKIISSEILETFNFIAIFHIFCQ